MIVRNYPKSTVWILKFFREITKDQSKFILQVIFHINKRFQQFKQLKIYHFGVEMQSHEMNLVLRKTAIIVRQVTFARRSFP